MERIETIEEFYKRKFDWMPDNLKNEIGHFNIFRFGPVAEEKPVAVPYARRDFYKVMLIKGNSRVTFADKIIEVKKQALTFSNPMIPYKWEHLNKNREGIYCIFNHQFFQQFGKLNQYEVFQPYGEHIFELEDKEVVQVTEMFERMENELNSDYKYKYDAIRNQIFELLHFALKMRPSINIKEQTANASLRISTLFTELLERQFPVDDSHPTIQLRTASDFASNLNVHVNHLNRAVKESTNKTTSQMIAERVLQEAKILLRQSTWSVSEISMALGFKETTHFNNFFKKNIMTSPLKYRNDNQ